MPFAYLLAASLLVAGCSGSGGFTEGFKIGKKDEARDTSSNEPSKGEQLGKETESDSGSADQPVQITGTYLTCVEESADDTRATFGCRLADKSTGATVALSKLASSWVFDYEIGKGADGKVTVREANSRSPFQVYFIFEADSRRALKALVKVTSILLDMVLRPGAGIAKVGPEIAGLIATFIPIGQSEVAFGSQDLADEVVTMPGPDNSDEEKPVSPGGGTMPPVSPVPSPDAGTVQPANPGGTPQTVVVSSDEPKPDVTPQAASKDPVVSFSSVYKTGGTIALMASFDQEGLTDASFTGGGPVTATNIKLVGDGSVTYRLSAEVAVSVKKGTKTCTASGAIITGNMSLPLVCRD